MTFNVDELTVVTEVAALAPSVHNTQPWRFVASGHTLEVRADDERLLSVLDPTSRQLHISCGVAIEFARLAVRYLGHDCVVRLLPGGADDPQLLATITIGSPLEPTQGERRLTEAIPRRYTDRGPYDDLPLPTGLLDRLRPMAAQRGGWLRPIDSPGERTVVSTLLAVAEDALASDPAYQAEMAAWSRPSHAPDGVPVEATTWDDTGTVTDVPLRDFTGAGIHPHPGSDDPPRVERDMLLLVGSDDDTVVSWLRTGRALGLVLLSLTDAGLSAQPLGPVTDVPFSRARLQRELGLLGCPQLLLRVGYGHGRPSAGRRKVEDLLQFATAS